MSVVRKILSYTKRHTIYIILSLLCSAISVAFTLYIPVLVGNAIDYMIKKGAVDFKGIIGIILEIAVFIVFVVVFQWLSGHFTNIISARTVKDLRSDIFGKLNRVPIELKNKAERLLYELGEYALTAYGCFEE